ncbi:MAG TPA: hypothetical protein VKX28_22870 [Xanthobacteraceae bacterium]|jgi:hypothetical protein|nr:hypothetical protein [Xanthobacteraceae bacterium]
MRAHTNAFSPALRLLAALALVAGAAAAPARADEQKFGLCHAGLIKLPDFQRHIRYLRGLKRYSEEDLKRLIERNRKGGPEFFSSQIVEKAEPSGSGTYDLRAVHGILDAADYRNITAWTCNGPEDFPIVYFVGFRVRKIEDDTIYVSREKDVVNVISLHELDPNLDHPLAVKLEDGKKVLCEDVNKRCDPGIFYDNDF